ncbi:2-C-methyl-D-erythritol 4-phosphate cytidylyltransferase [bacterium HR26]|nr:2-C-methyl-D-erythritol 4-phosphate cytidylyltransferase [bacterium HR26]
MRCGAIIAAAGSSRRMHGLDKTLAQLAGRPALAWVLDAVAAVPEIAELVVVVSPANHVAASTLCQATPLAARTVVCLGGTHRQDSVRAGVERLSPEVELVLIHDAARPLVTPELLRRGIEAGAAWGAAVAVVPVSDTIKQVDASGQVVSTLDRSSLVAAQTPQVFRRDWLEAAYRHWPPHAPPATDEAMLVERAGFPVQTFPGSPDNLKLTTEADLAVAAALLARRRQGAWA